MSTVAYNRRIGKTGRPLGLLDVLSKIIETAGAGLAAWSATRRAARLAKTAARRDSARDAADVRRMAYHYRNSAPGFASDLYAAADQHELQSGR